MSRPNFNYRLILTTVALCAVAFVVIPVAAQTGSTSPASPINFSGTVESVAGNTLIVNGLRVDISAASVPANAFQPGTTVTVVGFLQNGIVLASNVFLTDIASIQVPPTQVLVTATPVPPFRSDRTSDDSSFLAGGLERQPRLIIVGPVRGVGADSITVFDINVRVNPADPALASLRAGDFVYIEGDYALLNNAFQIIAQRIMPINPNLITLRRSFGSDTSGSFSSGTGTIAATVPPPPPARLGSDTSGRSSGSDTSGASATSGRGSRSS